MNVPDADDYDPVLDAYLATGYRALEIVQAMPTGQTVAIDTETPSVDDPFVIKCVTAAWVGWDGRCQSVLLDPIHNDRHRLAVRHIIEHAAEVVLHNASFDICGLVPNQLMTLDEVDKISDTLVYARMAYPDVLQRKTLEALSIRHLGMSELSGGMDAAFAAAGYKSRAQGFAQMDIDSPVYRFGAMADTVATLRLLPEIRQACVDRLLDHPFDNHGITTRAEAEALMEREQIVNRVMLRRSGAGMAVDLDYLDRYRGEVTGQVLLAEQQLSDAGIKPGATAGFQLVTRLCEDGELPQPWPKTPGGRLKADKDNLETLDHPLAQAHRDAAHFTKVLGYLEKVEDRSRFSGRLHPQVNVLGASATGRMSASQPELQQFPAEARPILLDDGDGLTSIDWAQIEPVTLANMAGDLEFLAPFEAGADLYEPIMRAAGVSRKVAKVVLLALMYGLGERKLAIKIGASPEAAAQVKRQVLAAMPASAKFMGKLNGIAAQYGLILTISGRVLPVPSMKGEYMAYKAINYSSQGSAYDLLACSIVEAKRRGIADQLYLAMHDELVCASPVADELREIMMTPPPELIRWAGRVPVLRTDMAHLGRFWHDPEHPPKHLVSA